MSESRRNSGPWRRPSGACPRTRRRRGSGRLASLWWRVESGWLMRTGGKIPKGPLGAVLILVALAAAGWASGRMAPDRSGGEAVGVEPGALPSLPEVPLEYGGVPIATYLEGSVSTEARDAFLASPLLSDPEFAERFHWWVHYWTGPARAWFPGFLTRMAWLGSTVDSALVERDFPPSLRYLPLIESGYAPWVTSRVGAVGLWQFMAPTGRELGLEITPLVDERRDLEKSTEAALLYLSRLQGEFDSWFFALAAYNTGPTRVRRMLAREAPGEPRTDSLFWALRDRFSFETREFVPKLYGAMWVASRPEAYGYEVPRVAPIAFTVVRVPDETTLDVVARAAGVSHADVLRLNAQFVRGVTPRGRAVDVRIPAGRDSVFAANYALIPPEERVTFVEHLVATGDTFATIATRYGVQARDIELFNPDVQPRALTVGSRLTVPIAPSVRGGEEGS